MGAWYLSLAFSLFLIMVGMTTHWIVMLAGLLLLFVPVISMLYERRRRRARADKPDRQEANRKA
jgi:membrane protein implicated in regulation of membrane protease activity